MSLIELQKPPGNHLILSGPPGAGKSTFYHKMLTSLAIDRPVMWVVTNKED